MNDSNDSKLMKRLEEAAPEELTREEIQAIRARLPHSAELQEAMRGQLRTEAALHEHLGRFEVSVDAILDSAAAANGKSGSKAWMWAFLLLLAIGLGSGGWLLWTRAPENVAQVENLQSTPAANLPADEADGPAKDSDEDSSEQEQTTDGATETEPEEVETPVAEPPPLRKLTSLFEIPRLQGGEQFGREQLEQRLREVKGKGRQIYESHGWPAFRGWAKLGLPWREDGMLRLSMFEAELKIYLRHGTYQVTIDRLNHDRWAAYITPDIEAEKPSLSLAATDGDLYRRSYPGVVDLRYQDGQLLLTRGNLRLMSVPMPGPPEEVVFDGKAGFETLEMVQAEPLPPQPELFERIVFHTDQPAFQPWETDLPAQAQFLRLPDGSVKLQAEGLKQFAKASFPLPNAGLYAVSFRVRHATPGTALFLSDNTGEPRYQVNFMKDRKRPHTVWRPTRPGETELHAYVDDNYPIPVAGEETWVRMVVGPEVLHCFTSGDGQHWHRVHNPRTDNFGGYNRVGIACVPCDKSSIELAEVEVRELTGLPSLIPDDLQVPALAVFPSFGPWWQAVLASKPEEVDIDTWRRACAVRTLAYGPTRELGEALLDGLARECIRLNDSVEQREKLLHEISLLQNAWPEEEAKIAESHYQAFGQQLLREGHPRPWQVVSDAILRSPVWTAFPLNPLPEESARQEVLQLTYTQQWPELVETIQQMLFWNVHSHPRYGFRDGVDNTLALVQWAQSLAARRVPDLIDPPDEATLIAWRHPLIEELSKEGYNILAEFHAALQGKAYRDACNIISATNATRGLGLLPDADDPQLLVSLTGAIDLAMHDHPELQQTMEEQLGPVGRLRLREAITTGNVDQIKAATIQFYGTEAAAEAHLWLGDRALAVGEVLHAAASYEQANESASPNLMASLNARRRLVGAMLGRQIGAPPTESVRFGEVEFSPQEFERLVASIRPADSPGPTLASAIHQNPQPCWPAPKPQSYQARKIVEIRGEYGHAYNRVPYSQIDWSGRQSTLVVAKNLLIVSNRFHIHAYDLTTGQQKWAAALGGQQGAAHGWPLMPMRPVVAGDRLFIRRVTETGPELSAINLDDGAILWRQQPGRGVASDPVITGEAVFAFSLARGSGNILTIELVAFNAANGQIELREKVLEFRNVWGNQIPCEATLHDGRIFAAIGGTMLCCDLQGHAIWLRKQSWIPRGRDPRWYEVHSQMPWVNEDAFITVQPDTRAILCANPSNGRLQWRVVLEDLERVVGMHDDLLILQTRDSLRALSRKTGETLWQRPLPDLLHGYLCGGPGKLLLTQRLNQPFGSIVRLLWLDPQSGKTEAICPLPELTGKTPLLGPLLSQDDKIYGLFSPEERSDVTIRRVLYELAPQPDQALPPVPPEPSLTEYAIRTGEELSDEAAAAFPGWTLSQSIETSAAGIDRDWNGEKEVFVTYAQDNQPASFLQQVALPTDRTSKLHLKVGCTREAWRLHVTVNGKQVESFPMDSEQQSKNWLDTQIDLTRWAGQTVWVQVQQRTLRDDNTPGGWKELQIRHTGD